MAKGFAAFVDAAQSISAAPITRAGHVSVYFHFRMASLVTLT
jgi:hypothetical protein